MATRRTRRPETLDIPSMSDDRMTLTDAQRDRAGSGGVNRVVPESSQDLGAITEEIAPTNPTPTTTFTGEEGAGGGGTTYSDDAVMADENGEGGSTGELDPYKDFGQLFEDYARSNLGPQDTSEEEALIRQMTEQQAGMDVYNQRASMGRAGFGSSGAMAGIEGDIQRRAAQSASQDILGLRRQAEEDAFARAVRAAGISLDEARFASDEGYRQQVLDMVSELWSGGGGAPSSGDDGSGNPVDDALDSLPDGPIKDALKWAGDVNGDGTININDLVAVRGADAVSESARNPVEAVGATNVGDVHVPTGSEKENASTVSSEGRVPQPSEDAGSDGGGHYYWGSDGNLYKVPLATMSGDY